LKYWCTIGITLLILVAVLLPGSAVPDVGSFGLDKIIHFLLFFAWAVAIRFDFPFIKKILVFSIGIVFSFLTEVLQLFTEDRSFDFFDMLADAVGLATGLILSHLVIRLLSSAFKKLPRA
jgi:VanZ family protein